MVILLESIDAKTVATKRIEKCISVFEVPLPYIVTKDKIFRLESFKKYAKYQVSRKPLQYLVDPSLTERLNVLAEVFKQCCRPMSVKIKKIWFLIYQC